MKAVLPTFGKARRKQQAPTWRELLQLRPVRNPGLEWEEEDGRVVLHIRHFEKRNWKMRLVNLLISMPDNRRIVLDAIGTDVWQMTDGQNTLGRIAQSLAEKYKLSPREAELSLQQFFKELGRRGYVGFLTEDDTPQKPESQKSQPHKAGNERSTPQKSSQKQSSQNQKRK